MTAMNKYADVIPVFQVVLVFYFSLFQKIMKMFHI